MKRVSLNRKDFSVMTMYMGFEGGAVYTAEKDGMFCVVMDESSMAGFLSEEDKEDLADYPLASALAFDSAEDRTAYLMKHFGPNEEMQRHNRQVLQRLENMGFRKIGEWQLEEDELSFCLSSYYESSNILYVFICQGAVVFVGKAYFSLEKHFWEFKYKKSKQGESIRAALSDWKSVEIHALSDNGILHFGGFQINLVDGLFDPMISELNPPWN